MVTGIERRVRRLRRKIAVAFGLRAAGSTVLALGGAFGAFALAARTNGGSELLDYTPACIAGGALTALAAGVLAARRAPSEAALAAWLDARSRSGGAVLAAQAFGEELADPESERRSAAVVAELRPSRRGALACSVVGIALGAMGWLWPLPEGERGGAAEVLAQLVQRAAERYGELALDETLPALEREAVQELLRELAERARAGGDPTEMLRALDGLEAQLEQHAERARALAERLAPEARAAAEELAPELRAAAEELARGAREGEAESLGEAGGAEERLRDLAREAGAAFGGESAERRALFEPERVEDAGGPAGRADAAGRGDAGGRGDAADRAEGAGGGAAAGEPGRGEETASARDDSRAARLRRLAPSQRRAVESFFSGRSEGPR
jgi:hypothetical protein